MALEQAHSTVTEAERQLHTATERLARAAHQAVDSLSEYGARAEKRLRESSTAAGERSRELIDQVTRYVDDHPLAAIGIAAAVGFTLGLLIRRNAPGEHYAPERYPEEHA